MNARRVALCVAVIALCSACNGVREVAGTLRELQQVQRAVSKVVGSDNVSVNVNNGKYLTIGLVNTPLKELPAAQKKAKALEVAALAYRSYPSKSSVTDVNVVFVVRRSYLMVFNYTDATDVFMFSASELS